MPAFTGPRRDPYPSTDLSDLVGDNSDWSTVLSVGAALAKLEAFGHPPTHREFFDVYHQTRARDRRKLLRAWNRRVRKAQDARERARWHDVPLPFAEEGK